jgi:hypothetical protein
MPARVARTSGSSSSSRSAAPIRLAPLRASRVRWVLIGNTFAAPSSYFVSRL